MCFSAFARKIRIERIKLVVQDNPMISVTAIELSL